MSDKNLLGKAEPSSDTESMSHPKETEIYPKFEFRLRHQEKEWLVSELARLKEKFCADGPAIAKNDLLLAAIRHGFRYLNERERLIADGE